MNEPLLTIGAFARAVGLTASSLRYYDECGLLRPAEVDDSTGYRYYTPDLARRAGLVTQMRAAGMSIESMRAVLDGTVGGGQAVLRDFLEEQTARSTRTAALVREVLSAVEAPSGGACTVRVSVRGPELASALRQVRPAADHDGSSPLGCVLLEVAPGSVDVVATNRYWMAIRTLPTDTGAGEARVILSDAAATQLAAELDGYDRVVVQITDEGLTIGDRVVEGRAEPYPAHRILLSGLSPLVCRAVLSRGELVDAVEAAGRAEVVVELGRSGAYVRGAPGGLARQVSATITGAEVTVRLGTALTLRVLASTVGPQIEWAVSGADRPVQVSSPYQQGFLALLMPLGGA